VATAEERNRLREYINEPNDSDGWTDTRLDGYIDDATNLFNAAALIWGVKAATYAGLVDVSESGSSRSLSGLLKQAQAMRTQYKEMGADEDNAALDVPVIARIVRGSA
jgi:hypothetical protein